MVSHADMFHIILVSFETHIHIQSWIDILSTRCPSVYSSWPPSPSPTFLSLWATEMEQDQSPATTCWWCIPILRGILCLPCNVATHVHMIWEWWEKWMQRIHQIQWKQPISLEKHTIVSWLYNEYKCAYSCLYSLCSSISLFSLQCN